MRKLELFKVEVLFIYDVGRDKDRQDGKDFVEYESATMSKVKFEYQEPKIIEATEN